MSDSEHILNTVPAGCVAFSLLPLDINTDLFGHDCVSIPDYALTTSSQRTGAVDGAAGGMAPPPVWGSDLCMLDRRCRVGPGRPRQCRQRSMSPSAGGRNVWGDTARRRSWSSEVTGTRGHRSGAGRSVCPGHTGQRSLVSGQQSLVSGQRSLVSGHGSRSLVAGQWSMQLVKRCGPRQ